MATFNGNDDDNYLYGDLTDDSLDGFDGNDQLYGNDGNDILTGGTGNDYMQGNNGADVYMLSLADGVDEINNWDSDASIDSVVFDFATTDLISVYQAFNSSNLVFQYGDGSQLVVDYYFSGDINYQVDQFIFTDTIWGLADIAQRHNGTSYSETLNAFPGIANTINGLEGSDSLYGADNTDNLLGGIGNDALYGYDGDDILTGGADNDYMGGGNGADSYQIGLADGIDEIYNWDADSSVDSVNFTDVASTDLAAVFESGDNLVFQYGNGSQLTIDYYFSGDVSHRVDQFIFTDTTWTLADIAQHHNGTSYSENLYAFNDIANTINGMEGNDALFGGNNVDNLIGGTGNDALYGSGGDDILNGGLGNDYLQGDSGADTYLINLADGVDEIYNWDDDTGIDTVKFAFASSKLTSVFHAYNTNNLVFQYGNGSQLTVDNYFSGDSNWQVDQFKFTNATWTLASIAQKHNGTAYNDYLYAFDGLTNTINGLDGDDVLNGANKADKLNGGVGNDTLYGNDSNDVLTGGAGNDYLHGGSGSDTYVLGLADGMDEIYNYDAGGTIDTVKFNFASTNLSAIFESGDNLVFQYGNGGQLAVDYYFSGDVNHRVDQFVFTDATWKTADIAQRHNGTSNNEYLYAFAGELNTINGLGGDDVLYGDTKIDNLNGGTGNDALYGANGQDILVGDKGNDYLEGGNEADTYRLSSGDGLDVINNYDTDNSVDKVKFTDLASTDVTRVYQGFNTDSLILQYSGGQLTVDHFFSGDVNYRVAQFQFTDTNWNLVDIAQRHNGTSNGDYLYAFDGMANTLNGLAGRDNLYGGTGADALNGGSGNDYLTGNNGVDILNGGLGNDYLVGGSGKDKFLFDASLNSLTNVDSIEDYDLSGDLLVLDDAIFTQFAPGAIVAGNLISGAGAVALDANDFLVYDTATGALSYDADGNGADAAVQFATLIGIPALNAGDFLIV